MQIRRVFIGSFLALLVSLVGFSVVGAQATPVVDMTCHAEPKWNYIVNVRRGPSPNWGITRNLYHNLETQEVRVVAQDESGDWYLAHLPKPYENEVGWIWKENINLFGHCEGLPTSNQSDPTLDDIPPIPSRIALPDFAMPYVTLGAYDRAFLVKPEILYIRRTLPGDERERMQAHILMFDLNAPNIRIGATIGATPNVGGKTVSAMGREAGAFAAITGDYYAGNYWPQGFTVIDGEPITAPKLRSAFGITYDKTPFIGYFTYDWTWGAYVAAANGEVKPVQLMNVPCNPLWLCIYTNHLANRLPPSYSNVRVLLDAEYQVVDMVENRGIDIPDGHYVLAAGNEAGDWLKQNMQIGDQVQLVLPTNPPWQNFETIVSGGPRILVDGEFWQDCDASLVDPLCEEFDFEFRDSHYGLKSLPRAAVGYSTDAHILYAIVIEGYEVEDSGGATQRELAALFAEFGANQAMEFDGGGSASMFLMPGGAISDYGYEGERPISNALLFFYDETK